MKIVLLNPELSQEHSIVKELQSQGAAVLFAQESEEAWKLLQLHGSSVEIAIVHREGKGVAPGLSFVEKFKSDKIHSDLPYILTTSEWSDDECSKHQETKTGANAYLRYPFEIHELVEMIKGVLGVENLKADIPATAQVQPEVALVLEDASELFAKPEVTGGTDISIQLEMPPIEAPSETKSSPIQTALNVAAEGATQLLSIPVESIPTESISEQQLESATPEPSFSFESTVQPVEAQKTEDSGIAQEMPYLFQGHSSQSDPMSTMKQPVGDAVVPGGAAQTPDVETLKRYLLLREQDVYALSSQLKTAQEQIAAMEKQIRIANVQTNEFEHKIKDQSEKIEFFEKKKEEDLKIYQTEIDELKFQIKTKNDKIKTFEVRVREATEELDKIRERVRVDIRKIRVREKELENRLEIMKKDSEALIAARETKIIELKRKLDLVEFNMDLLQEQVTREKEKNQTLKEKLEKAAQAMRVAGGMLDEDQKAS